MTLSDRVFVNRSYSALSACSVEALWVLGKEFNEPTKEHCMFWGGKPFASGPGTKTHFLGRRNGVHS